MLLRHMTSYDIIQQMVFDGYMPTMYSNTTVYTLTTITLLSLPPSLPSLSSKSPTGVGWFIVETEGGDAQRIHKAVDYWAKYIVDQIRQQQQTHTRGNVVSHYNYT